MEVRFLFIPVLGDVVDRTVEVNVPLARLWSALHVFVRPHFDEVVEHVSVLFEGQRRDMFVGETSAINGRHIRNIRATKIYRNNTLTQQPSTDPESLPAVSGPAVLFPDRVVWT